MRFFLKFSLILTIILILTSIILPNAYGTSFPRTPGPDLSRQVRDNHLEYLEENQPQIVLLGDSTLVLGVDTDALAKQTGKSVYSIGIPGSASALWYLILKNNIVDSKFKPEYVLVVFRDSILTTPGYRVHGSYFELVDEYAQRNEPVFIQKSFINLMNPLEIVAEKYFPLSVSRAEIRNRIDANIRYFAPSYFNCDIACTDNAIAELFGGNNFEPNALDNAVNAAESYLYTPERLDFASQVEDSFLPDMINLANENDIQLVFVRIKVESSPKDSEDLKQYLADLHNYFDEKNISFFDFGNDPRFTHQLFRDTIHLNQTGRDLFTQLIADELKKIFLEKQISHQRRSDSHRDIINIFIWK